jgi:tetratricopeptide (TPR) repeat protein
MWQRREAGAYRSWMAIDPRTEHGANARRLLARADAAYLEGLRLFEAGRAAQARKAFLRGVATAPINPAHYLRLARTYRKRGLFENAANYYRKYIEAAPDGRADLVRTAGRELAELDPGLGSVFDPPGPDRSDKREPVVGSKLSSAEKTTIISASFVLAAALVWLLAARNRQASLDSLVRSNPELHPAIAYLVGSLRHELLKHRIGAVADVLAVLESGEAGPEQRSFLCRRLYGGVPLRRAWDAHLSAFVRALGSRFDPRHDRAFRAAGRSVAALCALRPRLAEADAGAVSRLKKAHEQLRAFDARLALQQSRLIRTAVDDALLDQVVDEVRGEYAASSVALDELRREPVTEPVRIEVPRLDLVLILKNLLRNAILAAGREQGERRVGLFVRTQLEPTGEEAVRLSICDSSSEPLTTEMIYEREMGSGLGLVTAAIRRYGGAVTAEPGLLGYRKGVTLRFFRAFEPREHEESAG